MTKKHVILLPYALLLRSIAFLLFFLSAGHAFSQDRMPITFGKILPSDFILPKSNVIDSNASAVIIADMGNTRFIGNKTGGTSYVFKRSTRIKIIDKKAFDVGTVKKFLYRNEGDEEILDNIQASTFNIENGKVVETKLDKKDVFAEKYDKNHIEIKFTLPALKEGSIIEYSYTITSDYDFNIPAWGFQNAQYPCLWSQYEIAIPGFLTYVFLHQGIHPFSIDKASEGRATYTIAEHYDAGLGGKTEQLIDVSTQTYIHTWAMKDLSAFIVENYISSPANYVDKIEFQLSHTNNSQRTFDEKNSWAQATKELMNESDFGAPVLNDDHEFSKEVEKMVGDETDILKKAALIYYFVRDNFTCTRYYDKYIRTSLADVFKKKSGGVGEINLLLACLLREAGIHTDPVLLSTRDFGFNYPNYPIMDKFNYVICRASVKGNLYYLDAANSMLGFSDLAPYCYNGHARIICDVDSGSVYFNANSIKESALTNVFIINDEKGNGAMGGSYESVPGYYGSYNIRSEISKSGQDDFFKKMQSSGTEDLKLENTGIDSLKLYDDPVKVHYEFSYKNNGNDIIYFSPMMDNGLKENPFKAAERKYPVEMLYPIDQTYILSAEIPVGYIVDDLPKSVKVGYNDNDGFFEYIIQKSETNIQLRCHLKLNKAFFPADNYNSLRDFFGYVVKKESEQIVFKKKN